MSNKERAQLTYIALQRRKAAREKGIVDANGFIIDNTLRIHKRTRRYGK
jgi:hypothetical protein